MLGAQESQKEHWQWMAFLISFRSIAGRALPRFEGDVHSLFCTGRISACIPGEGTSPCRDEEASQTPTGSPVLSIKNEAFDTAGSEANSSHHRMRLAARRIWGRI